MSEKEGRKVPPPFKAGFETYLSPFTYRYGTEGMRKIWSLKNFWTKVRKVWIAGAEVQSEAGLVKKEQVDDLKVNVDDISVEEILRLEKEVTGHDVAAGIAEYSEVAPEGGKIAHQGFTSEEPLSNVEIMQIRESFDLIEPKLANVLSAFSTRIEGTKDVVCMGWTHLQAAEPTTYGYRFAKYAQDLLVDSQLLDMIRPLIKGKGIKGAVGTSASFEELLKGTGMTPAEHEEKIMKKLGLEAVTISDQTYPRKMLLLTEMVLSSIGQSLHRMALDMQLLQSSPIDEVSEPRRKGQIGSSAMPHKRNPIIDENIDSITEMLPGQLFSAWMTSAFITLERTLRDSAGKRSWLPESFLIVDEALTRAEKVIAGLEIHEDSIKTNLNKFAPFSVTEIILNKLSKAGMDRKRAHEILVKHSEDAIAEIRKGKNNPMKKLISGDEEITSLLGKEDVEKSFEEVFSHTGDASKRCTKFLNEELIPVVNKKIT